MTDYNNQNHNEYKDDYNNNDQRDFIEIHVKGHLDESWSEWLEGMEVKLLDNGEMILIGLIRDQAALMGMLNKLYRLNLTLLSVSKVNQKQ
jgi:hypothetical protein